MTERIYNFIVDYFAKNSIMPTTREIMEGVMVTSTSTVSYHINKLIKQGKITKETGKSRAIKLVKTDTNDTISINIYNQYKVEYLCKFWYLIDKENCKKEEIKWTKTLNGAEFVELILKITKDRWFEHIKFEQHKITISHFNVDTGEGSKFIIKFKEI